MNGLTPVTALRAISYFLVFISYFIYPVPAKTTTNI
jgi:hypothetical protein